ncbi:MAG: hypothetical protein PHD13_01530 [Methanocellales archaeon]|nr:hypothetical protein [Methanocellales archaeon]MDD3290959.1 hypothetical protein [Methanocellales archaeon]MDD5234844.1 hypothetical protein [Methanocellales archaeon]MDD5484786.1 hypothetical protein [Methanocellales archaeon]
MKANIFIAGVTYEKGNIDMVIMEATILEIMLSVKKIWDFILLVCQNGIRNMADSPVSRILSFA